MAQYFTKEIKSPFLGENIKVYADLPSASFFHNGFLLPVLEGIRSVSSGKILNEDNEIEVLLRAVSPGSFRITFRLDKEEAVKAMIIKIENNDFELYIDPLV